MKHEAVSGSWNASLNGQCRSRARSVTGFLGNGFLRKYGGSAELLIPALMLGAGLSVCVAAQAQSYPTKPVRIITGGVGGGSDFTGRMISQELTVRLGQQVIIENRGGASGAIAVQTVINSAPDGHTLLYYSGSLWIIPLLQTVPWDALRDFVPVTLAASAPNILVIHPQLPAKSVRDLIALARSRPGELNYGSGVMGSSMHLAAELFKSMAQLKIMQVNYRGAGPAVTELMAGQVQLVFASAGAVTPQINAGRLRALAVTTAQRSVLAPGLPTVAESGLSGFEMSAMYALFAPTGTPLPVVARLHQYVSRYLRQPDVQERFVASGVEAVGNLPNELTATIKAETLRLGKVVAEAGIRVN